MAKSNRFLGMFAIAAGSTPAQEKGREPRVLEKPSRLGTIAGGTIIFAGLTSLALLFNHIVTSGEGHEPGFMNSQELQKAKHLPAGVNEANPAPTPDS